MLIESLNTLFENRFKAAGQKDAIVFFRGETLETRMTYDALQKDINRFTAFLSAYPLEKGDRVILLLEKSIITVVAHLALLKKGVIVVPVNPGFKKNELSYLFKDAGARLILADPDKKKRIQELDPHIPILEIPTHKPHDQIDFYRDSSVLTEDPHVLPTDPGLILYTSGTTGNPKGAVLTHENLACDANKIILSWEISQTDVLCHALPLFHIHGLCFALHTALLSGAQILMLDRFAPETVFQRLSSKDPLDRCTLFMAVPAMYTKLMDYMGDQRVAFDHLRLLTSGSAPLLEKEFKRITTVFGKKPVEREGMSETGMNFSNPLTGEKKPGSIGPALPGVGVRTVDPETGEDVKPGNVGEFWLKSPSIIKEYWQNPSETEKAFKEGWFKTGDLGRADKDGYYYLTDRLKNLIITGGENVSAKEVETIINKIDGVKESCVVGIPDKIWGEKVVVLVEKSPGSDLSESKIRSVCKENLHDWKCPKIILFTGTLPKNTMGKVLTEKVKAFF